MTCVVSGPLRLSRHKEANMTRIHLSLRTADLAATTAFYAELLGTDPDKVEDGYVRFMPKEVPILLSITPGEPAVDHMGIRIDDPQILATQALRLGQDLNEGVVCCHAEKTELWRQDPDGRAWELYGVTNEQPQAAPAPSSCCEPEADTAASCCG